MHPFTSGAVNLLNARTNHLTPMKILPTPPQAARRRNDDSLGHGMDAVITLMLFLGLGFGLDTLIGTTPIFMIVFTIVGAAGLFARFYYQYSARMDEHDAERLAKLTGRAAEPSRTTTVRVAGDDGAVR